MNGSYPSERVSDLKGVVVPRSLCSHSYRYNIMYYSNQYIYIYNSILHLYIVTLFKFVDTKYTYVYISILSYITPTNSYMHFFNIIYIILE